MVDDDVARLARGVGADDALDGHDLTDHGVLDLVGVEGDVGHVEVGVRLEEVQLGAGAAVGDGSAGAEKKTRQHKKKESSRAGGGC